MNSAKAQRPYCLRFFCLRFFALEYEQDGMGFFAIAFSHDCHMTVKAPPDSTMRRAMLTVFTCCGPRSIAEEDGGALSAAPCSIAFLVVHLLKQRDQGISVPMNVADDVVFHFVGPSPK